MDDDKKVTPIEAARQKRDERTWSAMEDAFSKGHAFKYVEYMFDDTTLGLIDDEDGQRITLLTDALQGIIMSKEDAERLGVALIQASFAARSGNP